MGAEQDQMFLCQAWRGLGLSAFIGPALDVKAKAGFPHADERSTADMASLNLLASLWRMWHSPVGELIRRHQGTHLYINGHRTDPVAAFAFDNVAAPSVDAH
jgi:hypothetical protein